MSINDTIAELKSGKKKTLIAPSVLSADFTRLKDELQAIEAGGADWLHVDVMDGDFVPNLTMGMFIVEALKKMTKLPLDVHLMIQRPERYIDQFAKAGAEFLTVHPEAEGYPFGALDAIKKAGVKAGLALKPATPVSVVNDYLSYMDMLLIMTVNPGFSGQAFIESVVPKIKAARELLKANGPQRAVEVVVDGGINPQTARIVEKAGATVAVAGHGVFRSPPYEKAIQDIRGRQRRLE